MEHFDIGVDFRNIIHLFHRILRKRRGEEVDLEYIGKYMTTAVVLIGKPEVVSKWGSEPYINYIKQASKKGVDTFYILAQGIVNSFVARDVVGKLESNKDFNVIDFYQKLNGKQQPTALIAHLILNTKRTLR